MSPRTDIVKTESQPDDAPRVAPACDVYENDDELLVVADVPGVAAGTLDIQLDEGELRISARRETHAEHGSYVCAEYSDCNFQRSFVVPSGIDATRSVADLKDGVLWLHLPKSESAKPRRIEVRSG